MMVSYGLLTGGGTWHVSLLEGRPSSLANLAAFPMGSVLMIRDIVSSPISVQVRFNASMYGKVPIRYSLAKQMES